MPTTRHCYHCNEAIPENLNITSKHQGRTNYFCCTGCLGVAEWIQSEGLDQYYKVRTSSPKADHIQLDKFKHYDLPEIYQKYTRTQNNITEITLLIEGIHCAACMWLIERALINLKGVHLAQGNATTLSIVIHWNDQQVKLSEILTQIYSLGYNPVLQSEDTYNQTIKQVRRLGMKRLIISGIGMMQVMMYSAALYAGAWQGIEPSSKALLQWVSFLVTTPVYFYAGIPFITSAIQAISRKSVNMDVPVALAITLAYFSSIYHLLTQRGDIYFDSVVMFIFFLSASRYIELMGRYKAMISAEQNQAILPEICLKVVNHQDTAIPLDALKVGETIRVKAGETIPADGYLLEGKTSVSESLLTGEEKSIQKLKDDLVYAGSINQEQNILVKVTKTHQETLLAETKRLLNQARTNKTKTLYRVDQLAKYVIVFILVSTILSYLYWEFIAHSEHAFQIALSVLVATCPCALSLAIPTVYAAVSNRLAKKRLFIKKNIVLDKINKVKHIIFDKTGTLTNNKIKIGQIVTYADYSKEQALQIASAMERHIHHPIADAFAPFYQSETSITDQHIKTGKGVSACIHGKNYYLGSHAFIVEHLHENLQDQFIYLADQQQMIASFELIELTNTYAKPVINSLRDYQLHIASGDSESKVKEIADELGISSYHANFLPKDKLAFLKTLQTEHSQVIMIGDGINDAPTLAGADISLAIGDASTLSKAQADIVIASHDLRNVVEFIQTAKKANSIIRQNLTWAILYNLFAVPMALLGFLPPWTAALGMSLSSLIVLLNSLRIYL